MTISNKQLYDVKPKRKSKPSINQKKPSTKYLQKSDSLFMDEATKLNEHELSIRKNIRKPKKNAVKNYFSLYLEFLNSPCIIFYYDTVRIILFRKLINF